MHLIFECNRFFVKCCAGVLPCDPCHRSLGGYSNGSRCRGRKPRLGKVQGQTYSQTAVTVSEGNAIPDDTG